jgi:hypothetical protein
MYSLEKIPHLIYIKTIWLLVITQSTAQPTKINDNTQIACHNCYELKYAPTLVSALNYTTILELDIWDSKWLFGGWGTMNQDWYVKHSPLQSGNANNCGTSLTGCLRGIKNWSDKHKNHKPIIIFLDKKESWSTKGGLREPLDLDKLILSIFSRNEIYSIASLKRDYTSLREAVANNSWNTIDDLKGMILFVLTDATLLTKKNSCLNEYVNARGNNAVCFIAPQIETQNELKLPKGINENNCTYVVIYNVSYKHCDIAIKAHSMKFLSRVYNAPETKASIKSLLTKGVNFIALFNYRMRLE